jgi:hypothetical protein
MRSSDSFLGLPHLPEMQTDFQDRLSAMMGLTDAGGGVGFER